MFKRITSVILPAFAISISLCVSCFAGGSNPIQAENLKQAAAALKNAFGQMPQYAERVNRICEFANVYEKSSVSKIYNVVDSLENDIKLDQTPMTFMNNPSTVSQVSEMMLTDLLTNVDTAMDEFNVSAAKSE